MNFMKKSLCALLACAMLAPSVVFADESEQIFYAKSEDISLLSTDDISTLNPLTDSDIEFINYVIEELKECTVEIQVSPDYKINSERFPFLWQYISADVQNEHPELFYISGCRYYTNPDKSVKSLTIEYMNSEKLSAINTAIADEVDNVEALIEKDMTDLQKVLIVHDYIAANYEYDKTYESRTLDTMVIQKKGVCQGYSYLFKYILNDLDIECVTVPSTAHSHMWNKVKLDDEWYNVDLTYDDPLYDSSTDSSTNISHKFFLLNDEEIKAADPDSHSAWNEYKWDGTTPVETSDSTKYSNSVLHDIPKQTVYKDGDFYCFDSENNICAIEFEDNNLKKLYTDSSDFKWFTNEQHTSYYEGYYSAMVLYKGDIYFNSHNSVFKYNPDANKVTSVYEYTGEQAEIAHIFGLKIRNGKLNIEYTSSLQDNNIEKLIPIEIKDEQNSELPCSSEIIDNEDGTVTVNLSIPENIEETPKVYIAEFDENGVLICFSEKVTFTPEDNCEAIKAFIWSEDCTPLAETAEHTVNRDTNNE